MFRNIILIILVTGLVACQNINDEYIYPERAEYDWLLVADTTTNVLINKYWNESSNYFNYGNDGKDKTFHYWPQAHAMDVLIDAYIRTGDIRYKSYFEKWHKGIKEKNGFTYKNDFVDDMEWIALTMLRLYDVTEEKKYLDTTLELWNWIKEAWNEDVGGGLRWCMSNHVTYSKNACSNGPAAILAARLYNRLEKDEYLEWAIKIYEWEKETLVNSSSGAVQDNIIVESSIINGPPLTYNEGTYIGAAIELFKITQNPVYLNDAKTAAMYTITTLINTSNNILRDEGTGDNSMFKGIFMRYYRELMETDGLESEYRNKFSVFFNNNAYILWTYGTYKTGNYDDDFLFGQSWDTPPIGFALLTSEVSACLMFEAKAAYDIWNIKNNN